MKSSMLFALVLSVLNVSGVLDISIAGIDPNAKNKEVSRNSQCAQNIQRSSLIRTKLIIVDGLPGSGKSTTAKYIKTLLDNNGISNCFYEEGNFAHPIGSICSAHYEKMEKLCQNCRTTR